MSKTHLSGPNWLHRVSNQGLLKTLACSERKGETYQELCKVARERGIDPNTLTVVTDTKEDSFLDTWDSEASDKWLAGQGA